MILNYYDSKGKRISRAKAKELAEKGVTLYDKEGQTVIYQDPGTAMSAAMG